MKRAVFFLVPLTVVLTVGAPTPVTSSDAPYTVVDCRSFWRTWAQTTGQINQLTGAVTEQTGAPYTELGCGMHYWSNGQWLPSQSLIELTPTGAAAVQGQHQARFPPT